MLASIASGRCAASSNGVYQTPLGSTLGSVGGGQAVRRADRLRRTERPDGCRGQRDECQELRDPDPGRGAPGRAAVLGCVGGGARNRGRHRS